MNEGAMVIITLNISPYDNIPNKGQYVYTDIFILGI